MLTALEQAAETGNPYYLELSSGLQAYGTIEMHKDGVSVSIKQGQINNGRGQDSGFTKTLVIAITHIVCIWDKD